MTESSPLQIRSTVFYLILKFICPKHTYHILQALQTHSSVVTSILQSSDSYIRKNSHIPFYLHSHITQQFTFILLLTSDSILPLGFSVDLIYLKISTSSRSSSFNSAWFFYPLPLLYTLSIYSFLHLLVNFFLELNHQMVQLHFSMCNYNCTTC